MKTEFFVISINYYEEIAIPSVVIILRNKIVFTKQDPDKKSFSSMMDFVKSLGRNPNNQDEYHKTSIVIPLEDYRKFNLKVGDRIECDMEVKNLGADFSN